MQIAAAVTESKGAPFAIKQLELGELRADEVRVRVAACGICHTDLIIRDQWYPVPLPAVLGHEGAGVVEAVGAAVEKVRPGDHVALSYGSCGACVKCHAGEPWVCHDFFARNFGAARPDGSTALRDGARAIHSHFFGQSSFATHAVAPERSVVKLDPDVPLEIVAPFGCGIQTGAGAVLRAFRARGRFEHRDLWDGDRWAIGTHGCAHRGLHEDRGHRCAAGATRARHRAPGVCAA
ncbi:MAG: alcohol dehydrogenase catalytic domain-containing protein [Solirubrobacteraceae bacterium]